VTHRTRIVCTLGPATDRFPMSSLLEAGMDVARLNFSHGTLEEHAARFEAVRATASARPVAVIADLQGPKFRLGDVEDGSVFLRGGDELTLTTDVVTGSKDRIGVSDPALPMWLHEDDTLLIDDGRVRLRVTSIDRTTIRCQVVEGGVIASRKGVNLPGVSVKTGSLTAKDEADLGFALSLGVDAIALSFVRSPADVDPVRALMDKHDRHVPVIAKLERPEAAALLDEIVDAFDGLMIARGDLGVEIPLEDVPALQKRAIRIARTRAKPVIVATQMLESMVEDRIPTRAEASDVVNSVLDGADAVMLSAETSVGAYPLEAVRTMARLVAAAERQGLGWRPQAEHETPRSWSEGVADAAVGLAEQMRARALVTFTLTGTTARMLATRRPPLPLIAFTRSPKVRNQLALVWGTTSFLEPDVATIEEMVRYADRVLVEAGAARPGDPVVLVAGTKAGVPGAPNTVRVHRIGELATD
jgi:pyruvate kinase